MNEYNLDKIILGLSETQNSYCIFCNGKVMWFVNNDYSFIHTRVCNVCFGISKLLTGGNYMT